MAEKWVCPFCNEEILKSAKACPYCGSDAETGWSEDRYMDGILGDDHPYEEWRTDKAPQDTLASMIIIVLAVVVCVVLFTQGVFSY